MAENKPLLFNGRSFVRREVRKSCGMEEPQKLFRLPGTIEEEEEKDNEVQNHQSPLPENPNTADSPLLGQRNTGTLSNLPRYVTLVRVSTQGSSIGGVGRQDSTR
ncbi:hypothetical protein WN51_00307 [Melipona quadrifasciata]|uniref:Uncharacterized protein n=1 Tax=Melipona quadrifasciata TaxID=166423 RepID=A0A0N0BG83_9HYME|nr:hypothetical protein WN51_00307 [Melipona quadrifasciata]